MNCFIPTDLSVDKVDVPEVRASYCRGARSPFPDAAIVVFQPAKHPVLVKRTAISQLWHKKDDQFWMPKAHVRIFVKRCGAFVQCRGPR